MAREESYNRLSSQITAMHQELREVRSQLSRLMDRVGVETVAPQVVTDDDGDVVFLPGTGTIGASEGVEWDVSDPEDGPPVVRPREATA